MLHIVLVGENVIDESVCKCGSLFSCNKSWEKVANEPKQKAKMITIEMKMIIEILQVQLYQQVQ